MHGIRLKPQESHVALHLATTTGVLECEEKALGTAAEPRWIPWRAVLAPDAFGEAKESLGLLDPDHERHALISAVGSAPIATHEIRCLRDTSAGSPLAVPAGSRCRSRSWSVYSAALRGLSEWDRVRATGVKPSSREVAARALGSSKAWTPARIKAFEDLSGLYFGEAMSHVEPTVKLRGPIRWSYHGAVGDGLAGHPWIGLPASMVASFDVVEDRAQAVLVIENEKTFEEVIRRTTLSDDVLCLFGGGFLGEAEISLLRQLRRPVFAWCDLDPKGIEIVGNIAERIDARVTPLLMSPDLLIGSPSRPASADDIALALEQAQDSLTTGLAPLAATIAEKRVTVEQEALHSHITRLPTLLANFAHRTLEDHHRP